MTIDIDKERADFEAAGTKLHGWGARDYARDYTKGVADQYTFLEQRRAFALWQARATIPPAPAAPVEQIAYLATLKSGSACFFGDASTATAWAGPHGTVKEMPLRNLQIVANGTAQAPAAHQQRAPDENAQAIGLAHIICDEAGIPAGAIIARLVALSGRADTAKGGAK